MADDKQSSTPGMVSGLVQEYIAQLRKTTEIFERLAGFGERGEGGDHRPAGGLPLPGAFSASQLTSIAASITAQRRSIEALRAQLSAFDEQLAALERIWGPLADWAKTWVGLEERLLSVGRKDKGKDKDKPGD
jgi:hypothetical protein